MSVTGDPQSGLERSQIVEGDLLRLAGLLRDRLLHGLGRQLCRYRLMRLRTEAGLAGWVKAESTAALDAEFQLSGDWIATPQALELMPSDGAGWTYACAMTEDPIDPGILGALLDLTPLDVGPNAEQKYRISGVTETDGMLRFEISPTTWRLGSSFHGAIMTYPSRFSGIAVPIPLGSCRLPGLAVVHCIVITSDRQILLSQRSDTVAYAPLHWSASYEEQVTTEDVMAEDGVFHRCAQRGLREEFGIDVAAFRIHLVSMLLQMDNLNLGAVMLIEIAQTVADVQASWLAEPRPSHASEAHAIAGIDAEPDGLTRLSRGEAVGPGALHATSKLRFAIAASWLRRHRPAAPTIPERVRM
jgi:hypothetical protein